MFLDFDSTLLDDPEFKEDSVREELISPLLKRLGYSASGPHKIVRSRGLAHPFVYIGTKKHGINIIPDYLLEANEEHTWVLDAKAPSENLRKGKNPEQAFSYAIHPEVRAKRYALCNGKELVVYDVNRIEPILILPIAQWDSDWEKIRKHLSPLAFIKPELLGYKPDFGLFMYKSGAPLEQEQHFIPLGVPMVAKVEDGLYTFLVNIQFGDDWLAASFDFDEKRYQQLLSSLPEDKANDTRDALRRQPYKIHFEKDVPELCIHAKLGKSVLSNENEDYCPLQVVEFKSL